MSTVKPICLTGRGKLRVTSALTFQGGNYARPSRFTDDQKSQASRIALVSGLVPIGSQNEDSALAAMVAQHQIDFNALNGTPPYDTYQNQSKAFDKWTGRAVLNWTPKLDFTDQTTIYGSYARIQAGGFNPAIQPDVVSAGLSASYQPEGIDAFELGSKTTLLDGTLQANLTAWYYNYEGLQVSSIIDNTSINTNVGARLWGLEGEFIYAPDDKWQFNLNFGHTDSSLDDRLQVDPRNPSGGRSDVVLVKDATPTGAAGQNCVLYRTGAGGFSTQADAHIPATSLHRRNSAGFRRRAVGKLRRLRATTCRGARCGRLLSA
jgi:iron complex outermembrane receptor protein